MQEHRLPLRQEGYRQGGWQGVRRRGWSLGMEGQASRLPGIMMGMHRFLKQQ